MVARNSLMHESCFGAVVWGMFSDEGRRNVRKCVLSMLFELMI